MPEIRNTEPLKIRGLEIFPPIALAPMVGLSHSALRTLVNSFGGVGLYYTEMLAAKRIPHDNPLISPLLVTTEKEKPLVYQLITGDVSHIEKAVAKLHSIGADGIDLNLGCPAPMQKRQGAGASLAENMVYLSTILRELRKLTELCLSVKIRLGRTENDNNLIDYIQFLEEHGVDFITIHARLYGEKFCRKPRWGAVQRAISKATVPIFVNGGIFSVEDAKKCLEITKADGIMIGRGAIERPWLCSEIAEEIYGIPKWYSQIQKEKTYYDYISLVKERFIAEKQLGRLKQFTHYYARSFTFGHHLASGVQGCASMEDAERVADKFFTKFTSS